MKVAIIMGSDSDWSVMSPAYQLLNDFKVESEVLVASAHRTPDKVHEFAVTAKSRGVGVVIAAAGGAAHLPGVVAAFTELPVIGVPVNSTSLGGIDGLLSIAQMPSGIPVATMAVNGAKNAALFAIEILALANTELAVQLSEYRQTMKHEVESKDRKLKSILQEEQS